MFMVPSAAVTPVVDTQEPDLTTISRLPASSLEQLCQDCLTLNPHRVKRDFSGTILTAYDRIDQYPSYPCLEITAEKGCPMCSFLRASLLAVQNPRSREADSNETHPFWGPKGEDVALSLPWDRKIHLTARFEYNHFDTGDDGTSADADNRATEQGGGMVVAMWLIYGLTSGSLRDDGGNEWGTSVLVFPAFDSIDLESPDPGKMRRLPSSQTLSAENVGLMNGWIQDCVGKHSGCPAPARSWLPSRLIEMVGNGESLTLRLTPMTDDHIASGCQYVALSHVWGDMTVSPPYRTFKSNIEQHKVQIDTSKLPRNFQDAVRVTWTLGIRFLWIDSLCIIQDSDSDWREQALQMHLVYRHALVTIVATQASSSHSGFLQRDVELSRAIKVEYESDSAQMEKRHSFILCRHRSSKEGQRIYAVDGARWNTRGWTMQERSLSTRIIHFCRNKLFFECRGSLLSEENEPPQEVELVSHVMWPRDENVSTQRLYANWELHVNEYCRRDLTNCRDKLPAIHSIAEEMSERTGMEYVACAGMWRPYFKRELLWTVGFGKASKPPVPRAPSWSWASLEAHTNFVDNLLHGSSRSIREPLRRHLEANSFQVLEVSDPGMSAMTGQGHHGHLRVKTLTKMLQPRTEKFHHPGKWRNFFPIDFYLKSRADPGPGRQVVAHGKFDVEDDRSASSGAMLYAHIGESSRITGLILEQVSDGDVEPCLWRRIGVATLFEDRTGELIANDVLGVSDTADIIVIV